MSIEVKALTKIYGDQKAVDVISFNINKGEIVADDKLSNLQKGKKDHQNPFKGPFIFFQTKIYAIGNQCQCNKQESFFMKTTGPIKKRWNQEGCQDNLQLFTGINIDHYPVHGNGSQHGEERIKNNIDIIITKTEQVEKR